MLASLGREGYVFTKLGGKWVEGGKGCVRGYVHREVSLFRGSASSTLDWMGQAEALAL